jgi:hypothetical protein
MHGDAPDAVYARPGPSWREREYPPGHAPVWVRAQGTWLMGVILRWVTIDPVRQGWECQIEVEIPGAGRRTARYVYDEQAIRPRYGPAPPSAQLRQADDGHAEHEPETEAAARLKPTGLEGGTVYAVTNPDLTRPGNVLGWVQQLPQGWRRYGYGDSAPVLATPAEAVADLITYDAYEQETATWP